MSRDETPEVEPEEEPEDKAEPEVEPETPEPKPKSVPLSETTAEPKPKKEPEVGYVSLRRFAKTFDISKSTAIRWIKDGKIKAFRTYTGQWRIPRGEVGKVMEEFRTQPAPERPPHLKPKREKREKREEPHERERPRKEEDDFI